MATAGDFFDEQLQPAVAAARLKKLQDAVVVVLLSWQIDIVRDIGTYV